MISRTAGNPGIPGPGRISVAPVVAPRQAWLGRGRRET